MQYLVDTGIVIKRINFGEADRYITLFTKNNGKMEVVAKGVRKITSKRASHIELLNLVRFQTVKTGKNHILTEIQVINSFSDNKNDLANISTAFLLCELVDKLCPPVQKHEDIYELMEKTIEGIQEDQKEEVMFEFQVRLLVILGFWDQKRKFRDSQDLRNFIESIIERKIKTRIYS